MNQIGTCHRIKMLALAIPNGPLLSLLALTFSETFSRIFSCILLETLLKPTFLPVFQYRPFLIRNEIFAIKPNVA